jgi:hypothetical protein
MGPFGGFFSAAVSAGHAHTPTRTVESDTIAENERAVTVHMRQSFADLRRYGGLLRSPWRHRQEGTLSLCSSRQHTRDNARGRAPGAQHHDGIMEERPRTRYITPTAISSRGCLAAVLLQPGLELGRFIVENDPVQETAPQG